MSNFLEYIDTQIQLQLKLRATNDGKTLTGLRNIKSDFLYTREKNSTLNEGDVIKRMHKSRIDTALIYETTNKDLWQQEIIESNILVPFLPPEIKSQDIFEFLNSLGLDKNNKNFKIFQTESEKHFGQKIESNIILDYIKS